ncbi:MAG TPA: hypothetical protein VFN79_18075 [Steroidobacteraceae bacterium]|nr:hypothetical protein [Steroidobacteraceae bacterium]
MNRRELLVGGAVGAALIAARRASGIVLLSGHSPGTTAFDYYISTTGSDSNPGTLASPWALTSLTTSSANYSKIAGSTIGILNGTYDISTWSPSAYSAKLTIPAGLSSTQPTVIQAVNARAVTLKSDPGASGYVSGSVIGNGANGTGSHQICQYITLDGLIITGGTTVPASGVSGVTFTGVSPQDSPGIVIQNCEISWFINPSGAVNIGCITWGTGPTGWLIHNCCLHDCYVSGTARYEHDNASGVHDYAGFGTVEYCSIYGCNNAVYQKNQASTPPPQGDVVRYCYIHPGAGIGLSLAGFNNSGGTTPPYQAQLFYNNIMENAPPYDDTNTGANFLQSPTTFSNNTVVWTYPRQVADTLSFGYWVGPTTGAPWKFVTFDNNIGYMSGGAAPGKDPTLLPLGPTAGDWTRVDYNCYYGATLSFGITSASGVYPPTDYTLAQWQALTGTPDIHSLNSDPLMQFEASSFVADGGSTQYQLQSGSPCKGAGYGGIDIGAWGGTDVNTGKPIAQIGCNFSAQT